MNEATILLNSLNVLKQTLPALQGAQKQLVINQMQEILSYFEQHQEEYPLGFSVTLGYYLQSDLSAK